MTRRGVLQGILAAGLAAAFPARAQKALPADMKAVEALQQGWRDLLAPGAAVPAPTEALKLSNDEWRKRLPPDAYKVLRDEGTERPFTSPLDGEKRRGVFVCAGCAWPVFTSAMKFDSGTGWPSFFTTIPGAFETSLDHRIFHPRIEYHCAKCGGHHGHVFDDGPRPTFQRWCNNGVALRFVPA